MKLSVRSKVANGLVICLLLPRAAETAVELFENPDDGLDAFAAEDEFIPGAEGKPFAMVQLQANPAADPSACGDPSGGGTLIVNAPSQLTTAESDNCDPSGAFDPSGCGPFGSQDFFEVSMNPPPEYARTFYFEATADPSGLPSGEASVMPEAVVFDSELGCIPQSIWVSGQNDTLIDGTQYYNVDIIDEADSVVDSVPGRNLDNDSYEGVRIWLFGPTSLPIDGEGVYTIYVNNFTNAPLSGNDFIVEPTAGLAITSFAAELSSGNKFKSKGSTKTGDLIFRRVDLDVREQLIVTVGVVMFDGGIENQKITARFADPASGVESDDDHSIRTALP